MDAEIHAAILSASAPSPPTRCQHWRHVAAGTTRCWSGRSVAEHRAPDDEHPPLRAAGLAGCAWSRVGPTSPTSIPRGRLAVGRHPHGQRVGHESLPVGRQSRQPHPAGAQRRAGDAGHDVQHRAGAPRAVRNSGANCVEKAGQGRRRDLHRPVEIAITGADVQAMGRFRSMRMGPSRTASTADPK
jgi:hypothetical protein